MVKIDVNKKEAEVMASKIPFFSADKKCGNKMVFKNPISIPIYIYTVDLDACLSIIPIPL
tara:strand:- start:1663 stop:1842 length:180 start_codon:yes stop_codon:yes gene_type:complete